MARRKFFLGVIFMSQLSLATASKTCNYHTYNYGQARTVTYSCEDWEYCCSGVCCDYPILIHRLWYFWVGILSLAFFVLFVSVTWYKKRYYGRVLRVAPADLPPGTMQMHGVSTQQFISAPPYPGPYVAIPSGPSGPPPPYSAQQSKKGDQQQPPAGPMQPGYLPISIIYPSQIQADSDSCNHF